MQRVLSAAILSIGMLASAQAQTVATATTDLNIRSGPGPEHPVIGHIQDNQRTNVLGCIEGSLWCQVDHRGERGWAYSQYLTMDSGGRRVVITEPGVRVPAVTYQAPTTGVVVRPDGVVTTRARSGAFVAPPATTVVTTGPAFAPPPAAIGTYVTSNPIDPVYLDGEVVVGAGVPETVALRPVPDYRYQYVYVNGQPVLVDPATRRIVYVYR